MLNQNWCIAFLSAVWGWCLDQCLLQSHKPLCSVPVQAVDFPAGPLKMECGRAIRHSLLRSLVAAQDLAPA